jgi:hypothetical protein
VNHPSNKFANAFLAGQLDSLHRMDYGPGWPLVEFWKDRVKPHRKVVDKFVEPVLAEALAKRAAAGNGPSTNGEKGPGNEETLLNHLINQTQGFTAFFRSYVQIHNFLPIRYSGFEG